MYRRKCIQNISRKGSIYVQKEAYLKYILERYRRKYIQNIYRKGSTYYRKYIQNILRKGSTYGQKGVYLKYIQERGYLESVGGKDPDIIIKNPSESKGGVAQKLIKVTNFLSIYFLGYIIILGNFSKAFSQGRLPNEQSFQESTS